MSETNTAAAPVENAIDWEMRALRAEAKIVADKEKAKEAAKAIDTPPVESPAPVEPEAKEPTAPTKTVEELEAEISAIKAEAEIKANQETTNMMSMWGSEKSTSTSSYARTDLEAMNQTEYNAAKDAIDKWEATYTN